MPKVEEIIARTVIKKWDGEPEYIKGRINMLPPLSEIVST